MAFDIMKYKIDPIKTHYSQLTHLTFEDVLNSGHGGQFEPKSESLIRYISTYHNITYYEDNVNGILLPSNWREGEYISYNSNDSVPFMIGTVGGMAPGSLIKPNGEAIKKTHLKYDAGYIKFADSNVVVSTEHYYINLEDYTRGENSTELSLDLNRYSMIYLSNTQTLLYDPKPFIAHEPDPVEKEKRYNYVTRLFPIAQLWTSLHPHNEHVEQSIRHYNQTYNIKELIRLYDLGAAPEDYPDLTTQSDSPIQAMAFVARHLESGIKKFNNWINGITRNEYPFLLYNEDAYAKDQT